MRCRGALASIVPWTSLKGECGFRTCSRFAVEMERLGIGGLVAEEDDNQGAGRARILFGDPEQDPESILAEVARAVGSRESDVKETADAARAHVASIERAFKLLKKGGDIFIERYNRQVDVMAEQLIDMHQPYSFLTYLGHQKSRPGESITAKRTREAQARDLEIAEAADAEQVVLGERVRVTTRGLYTRRRTGAGAGAEAGAGAGAEEREAAGEEVAAAAEQEGDAEMEEEGEGDGGGDEEEGEDDTGSSVPSAFDSRFDGPRRGSAKGTKEKAKKPYGKESTGMTFSHCVLCVFCLYRSLLCFLRQF